MHSLRNIVSRVPRMTCRPKQEPTASSENTRHGSVHTCALVCVTGLGTPNQDRYGRCMRHGHAHCNNCHATIKSFESLRAVRPLVFGPAVSVHARHRIDPMHVCARDCNKAHTHKRKPTHCTDPRRCAPRLHGGDCTGGEGGQPTPGRISDCMTVTHAISFFLGAGGHDHGTDPSGCCVGLCPVGSMASRDSSRCIRTVKCRRAGRVLP
jgi:hypothetical protein